jgi:signal transduction histidine kinase
VIRISLRSARQLLLVLASPQHECRFVAVEGFCHQRSGLGRRFLAQLGVTLTREFDELVSIQHLLAEEGRRSAFLTRAAHSLSLPIQSIIADSANLLDDLDPSGPSYEAAVHNFREVQGLRLVTENLLHGAEEETDQPEPEYRLGSLLSPLREACEMFMGEASDKGCDIRPVVCLGDIEEPLLPTELDNLWLLYVRGFYQLLKRKARMPRRMTLHPADISCTMEVAGKETSVPVQNAAERCFRLLANGSATAKAARARIAMGDRSAWFPASTLAEMYLPGAQMVRDELALALQNILHNAVKYSYRTVPRSKKRYIDVRCEAREGKYCTVSVSNYGIGIEQYEIDEGLIWKPRYRGRRSRDRNRTGSGLGLSHARRAVERIHGGRIEARSVRQPGGAYVTTLVVTLPMTQAYRMDKETRDAQDEVATR